MEVGMVSRPEGILFEERQRLITNPVVVLVLGVAALAGLAGVLRLEPPISLGLALVLLAVAMLAVVELIVAVRPGAIEFRLRPLAGQTIPVDLIRSCTARRYRPILEYGGWGYRWGRGGSRAYNIRGNRGVQLVLQDGQKILIGSQRPGELASAIQAAGFRESSDPASPESPPRS
jgi:hypothetical protein